MGAKITHVETAAIRAVGPSVLVKVWAGDEYGLGECYPSAPAAGIHQIITNLEDQLVGEDPRNVEMLYEKLRRWNIFTGGQAGAVLTAISGIEMALWDLAGKLQGVPIYRLLGGAFRTRIRLYADFNAGTVDAAAHHTTDGGLLSEELQQEYVDVAREAVSMGFDAIKFDVDDVTGPLHRDFWNGAISGPEREAMVARVAAVREAVGPEVDLAIDMHGRFDLPSSIRFARAVEEFDLLWLEEPTPPENYDALAEIRRSASTPICAGENTYTRFDFKRLFDGRCVDYVMPDVAKCGGLAEGKRIANMAELDYIPFATHNVSSPIGTIAAAHVCAAVSNFAVLEWHAIDMPHWADFVRYSGGDVISDGHIELTEAPGLGLELNEEAAFEHRHDKGGMPFFERG
ncbi:MAG TPA: mandelate racemase/muconate lactonizing enzyme family protein [Rubrobacteraceae bacterium]|nr:mandelate racemase/muconate lactonizing enzyme family protein [Rubrobacteraceae bacterium]